MNQRRSFLKLVSLVGAGSIVSSGVAVAGIRTSSLRKVVLDAETTGLGWARGHRIIEIAAIEIVDREITGHCFHTYCDPERDLSPAAIAVTELTREYLTGKPKFGEVINALMQFIGDASLVIHNASFDLGFLDAELERLGREPLFMALWPRVNDTLQMARAKGLERCGVLYLCKHYGIPIDGKHSFHRLDVAEAIARIYLAMTV